MDNLFIKIVAKLNKAFSKKRIKQDIGELENTPFCIRLIGALNKTATRARIKQDVKSLSGSQTISVNGKIDKKSLRSSLKETKQQIEKSEKSNPVKITADINVNADRIDKVNQVQNDIISGEKGIRTLAQSYVNWNRILDLIIQSAQKAVDTTTDLAKAQTDLQIVTGKSNEQMQLLMRDYNQLAKDLSSTTINTTDAADEWLRQGKSISDTNELIRDSVVLSKIGQLEASEATKFLTSAINGYKVATKDAIGIVDKLSAVDLESATSAGGLAESMSKCANSANVAGVSMDNLIAYIATVSDVTQKSASVVGESFKTIFSRMGKVSIGDFIDEDGTDMTEQINQVEGILGKFNIKLRDSVEEFRDFEDVIYDVGMSWDSFTSVEKNAIAAGFGGVYQRENVLTLFENFDKVLKLSETSANSAGKAYEKFAVYEQSLEAATNRLTASFESLAYNTISSDFLKNLAIGAAGIVEVVDKFKLLEISLSALAYKGAIKGLLMLGTKMVAVKNNLGNLSTAMNLSAITTQRTRAENVLLGQSYSQLTPKQQKLILSNKKLNTEQRLSILTATGLTRAQAKAKLQTMGLITAIGKATKATASLKGMWNALKISIANNPIGLVAIALSTVGTAISTINQKQQELVEKAKEASEVLKQETDAIDDYADKVVELRKKLDEGNLSLEESKNVRVELQQIQDDLIDKYGDEAEGIDLVTGSIEGQIKALQNLKKADYEDAYKTNSAGYDAAVKNIQNVNVDLDNRARPINDNIQKIFEDLGFSESKALGFIKTGLNISGDIYSVDKTLEKVQDELQKYINNGEITGELTFEYKNVYDYIASVRRDFTQKAIKENEEMYAQWLQYSSNYSDEYLDITRKQSKLEYAIKNGTEEDIAKAREEFLTSYQNTLKKAGENGDTDVVNYLEKAFENTIVAAKESSKAIKNSTNNTAIPAVSNLVDEYKTLADAIDKVISKQNKLTEIYKKIMTGGSFSRDEVLGYLKEFPDLIDSVMMNEDGTFTFKLDNVKVEMDKSNDDLTNQIQAKVNEATKGVNVSIEDYFESDADYNNAFSMASSGFRSNADVSAFKEKYFAEHKSEYDKYIQDQEKAINGLSNVLGMVDDNLISQAENVEILDERYNNAVDNITQYNSSLDSIQEAISAVNAGQGLNYEQMTKLLEIDPSLSGSITERNGLYYIEIQALNDLKKARQEEQKEAIRLEKKKTEVLIVQTQQRVEAIGREMAASFAKRDQLWDEYTLQSQLLEGYKKILDGLDEYEYDPTQNSGGGSGTGGISDILQQQIDRYEVLLNAIEIVANKRIELLEAEKEALQDKNDEEQRELDLIEAKNNLDKAKKMKTIVYEKDKGFVQVENKKAISDAQKEYDDAVLEKRTAEIDKQIEGLENYAKPFSEMKSDIEDAITVEQAKKALKTDENGLLSLDEKTAKNIRDGLAGAVLKKDKKDNSGNPYYQPLPLDDLLKSLGATVTGEQAKAILSDSLNNMKFPQTNMQAFNSNTTNNSYVNNTSSSNRNVSLNSTFNIYDASDPEKVRSEIDKYFRDIAREIK